MKRAKSYISYTYRHLVLPASFQGSKAQVIHAHIQERGGEWAIVCFLSLKLDRKTLGRSGLVQVVLASCLRARFDSSDIQIKARTR